MLAKGCRHGSTLLEATLKAHVVEMRERLDQAAGIAKAAQACAEGGNIEKAIEIVLDIEQLIYEATSLSMPQVS